ncbi:hypothetical protein [Mesorhizobium sp. B2-8-3]|uniref:hypothetical protein n=1 Tax=Mesorhizobium sp. B2-8-3 TaxID=2589905 RepID=UPI001128E07C|nr:hypothetical protein [Mesorhizobium sp. B2-8-3]TPJ34404.1 hypothetical protein FJ418_10180 [Mesorhizobium sp. B2-8-3]
MTRKLRKSHLLLVAILVAAAVAAMLKAYGRGAPEPDVGKAAPAQAATLTVSAERVHPKAVTSSISATGTVAGTGTGFLSDGNLVRVAAGQATAADAASAAEQTR